MRRKQQWRAGMTWALATLAIAVGVTLYFWPRDPKGSPDDGASANARAPGPDTRPVSPVPNTVRTASTAPGPEDPAARKQYDAGVAAFEARPLRARTLLSAALFSGKLTTKHADDARNRLEYLAQRTLLGRRAVFRPDADPYTCFYRFKSGDVISRVERNLRLHVPSRLLLKINGLTSGSQFQAGREYKLIKGPFHAVIYKSAFVMDVYLYRREEKEKPLPPVFIKRYRVGLGAAGGTPVGRWRLGCGAKGEKGKMIHPPWDAPPNSHLRGRIKYGQPGYPFGTKGLWIALVGLDENTRGLTDYGIHSTNKPETIGRGDSLGCIRLDDTGIEDVFSMLYEYWSTVEVRP